MAALKFYVITFEFPSSLNAAHTNLPRGDTRSVLYGKQTGDWPHTQTETHTHVCSEYTHKAPFVMLMAARCVSCLATIFTHDANAEA